MSEKRKDARVAHEFEVALPHELDDAQRVELAREFSQYLADRHNAAVDFSIHRPDALGSVLNHHAHIMLTTRAVSAEGFGDKTLFERKNKWLLDQNLPTTQLQLKEIRKAWEQIANEHLSQAGFDVRIDARSHKDRGLELEPTRHVGVHATAMNRKGVVTERERLDDDAKKTNAELVKAKPEQILEIVSGEKSVFTKHDIARALHRYIHDDADAYQSAMAKVMASAELVKLVSDKADGVERFTTAGMLKTEADMMASVARLKADKSHVVDPEHIVAAIRKQNAAIRESVAKSVGEKIARGEISDEQGRARIAAAGLADEQCRAIEHVLAGNRVTQVVGIAGAGKSTMLAAAREAWEAQGYRVHGAALSGKAASGLRESSGIESRTLASWQYRWAQDRDQIGKSDVFVIDEAAMVGSRQLARFIEEIEERGAKIVFVGDHEQLQSIGAGAAFRAIGERIGYAELKEVRRQREDWQQAATLDFSEQRTAKALQAYRERGGVTMEDTRAAARGALVTDYLDDRESRPEASRVILTHLRDDVNALNAQIRTALQERGDLVRGEEAGEHIFQTNDGKRTFAAGDRIVFLENNDKLGVMNGNLGTVERIEDGRIVAKLDNGDRVTIPTGEYRSFDHGYATTIHKSQGDTVDRAFVLATPGMDRHLTYVAMSRHRDGAKLYAGREDFERGGGRLIEHGKAPFENNPENSESYYVTLANARGDRHTVWGVDLERAMQEAAPEIGERIGLEHVGKREVTLADGTKTHRNEWKVIDPDEMAFKQLAQQLGRDGSKEITVDYRVADRDEDRQQEDLGPAVADRADKLDAVEQQREHVEHQNPEDQREADRMAPGESGARRVDGSTPEERQHEQGAQGRAGEKAGPDQPYDRKAAYEAVRREAPAPMTADERKRAYAAARDELAAEGGKVRFGKVRGLSGDRPSEEQQQNAKKVAEQERQRPTRGPEYER